MFDRHVLMTASLPAATTQYIQQLVADLPHSVPLAVAARYGLQQMNAPCPNLSERKPHWRIEAGTHPYWRKENGVPIQP